MITVNNPLTAAVHLLPFQDEEALTFERLRAVRGVRWPLPEVSHAQFLADHNHAAWLEDVLILEALLHSVDLDEPWSIMPTHSGYEGRCALCDYETADCAREVYAVKAVRKHLTGKHGWTRG